MGSATASAIQTRWVERPEPFPVGASIVWRSRPRGDIGFVFGCRVLADNDEVAAVVQPTGAPISTRAGQRGGPGGRSLLPDGWSGARVARDWDNPPAVRLHPIGRSYSVIRTWLADEQRFQGWYVNLEQHWVRTTVGFDSRDDVLDITVTDDLRGCSLKDEDELAFAVEVGKLTSSEARRIRANAESAIDDVRSQSWPFDDGAWRDIRPAVYDQPPLLPRGWDQP